MHARDAALIEAARGLLGTPFRHQGRDAHGLDCLGLLLLAAQRARVTLPRGDLAACDRRDYGAWPDTDKLQTLLSQYLSPAATLQHGAVLLLRIAGRPQHLALVSDYPQAGQWGMIHAYAPARHVVEHRLDAHWEQSIHGIFTVPER